MKTVQLIAANEAFKAQYFDRERLTLRPDMVFVDDAGSVVFETNEVGLKGDALDPARKLIVVWGDSVVFSSGRGWPCLLDALAPGYQFLNGGLDGDPYTNILDRARAFNRQHGVALNIVMTGWHPMDHRRMSPRDRRWRERLRRHLTGTQLLQIGNRRLGEHLAAFLRGQPNTVLVTMPTALNPNILDTDLSPYFTDGNGATLFHFIGAIPYAPGLQRVGYEHIVERNAIVRAVGAALGIRVVDFFAAFDTASLPDFRRDFHDILHFRSAAYPLVAQRLHAAIADLLD